MPTLATVTSPTGHTSRVDLDLVKPGTHTYWQAAGFTVTPDAKPDQQPGQADEPADEQTTPTSDEPERPKRRRR